MWFHVDDEHFLVIAHEEGASTVGGQDAADLNWNHIVLHIHTLWRKFGKNKPPADWYLYGVRPGCRDPWRGMVPHGEVADITASRHT
jgi:hypothetical protein